MPTTIHFCDLCNESVPQSHLDTGLAFFRKGRVVCATCDALMGGAATRSEESSPLSAGGPLGEGPGDTAGLAPGPLPGSPLTSPAGLPVSSTGLAILPEPVPGATPGSGPPGATSPEAVPRGRRGRQGRSAGVGVASLTLVLLGVLAWQGHKQITGLDERLDAEMGEMHGQLRRTSSAQRLGERRLLDEQGQSERRVEAQLDAYRDGFEAARKEIREEIAGLSDELGKFGESLERVQESAALIRRHDDEIVALKTSLGGIGGDYNGVLARLAELESRPIAIAPMDPLDAPILEEPDGNQPPWVALLAGLESEIDDERWMAVDELGQTGDKAVVPHVLPLLEDSDTFVRMATARVLGELDAEEAAESLINALEDPEPAVREAAMVALHAITSRDFGFDPYGTPADRAKKVKAWRQWLRSNS